MKAVYLVLEGICSGIVLNRSIFGKDKLMQFVEERRRAKVRRNNLGERWEESVYRTKWRRAG